MFDKIVFKNKNEKAEFEKYKLQKGQDLYYQIYNILIESVDSVPYSEFSSYIRYDKSLRDKLYVYMATLEEYLRAQLLKKYDSDIEKKRCGHVYNDLIKSLVPRKNERSKLYYGFQPDFGDLMRICEAKNVYSISSDDQKYIKKLRNITMHHAIIMFGEAKTTKELIQHFTILENQINAFFLALPTEYRNGFLTDITNLNGKDKKYLDRYYLEVQDGRLCVKK